MRSFFNARFMAAALFLLAFASISMGQTTFPGSGTGAIADSAACGPTPGTPTNVTFNVTGIASAPTAVSVSMTLGTPTHTWMGDIVATLIAPSGASHTIFGVTGSTTATGIGDSSDLGGVYVFSDAAAAPPSGGWWQAAAASGATVVMPAGTYRTTASGGAGQTNPAPPTAMNAAFAAIPTSNGTWTLRFTDGCTGDTGNVMAASLTLTAAAPVNAPNDIDGDSKTDFTVVRGGVPSAGLVTWYTDMIGSAAVKGAAWGIDTDFFVIDDFVGDSKDDIAVWRPAAAPNAFFHILDSNLNTLTSRELGFLGCAPDPVGDWDGDDKADVALYCDGTAGSPQSNFYYRGSLNPAVITFVPYGTDGDVGYALDFDGDNKLDAAVQRNGGGGVGHHYIRKSGSAGATEFVSFGLSSDFVLPGDYDGDGREDIAISRNANFGAGTFKYAWIRESDGGGLPSSPVQFGIPGDFICPGDYDGDGKTDLAVWRSGTPGTFYYQNSASAGATLSYSWGTSGDYPVNNWRVH